MPFRSEKQRRFLWMHHPEIAKRWTKEHGSKIVPSKKKKKKSMIEIGVSRMVRKAKLTQICK